MKGRKRSLLVDTLGRVLKAVVHSAAGQDRDGGRLVLQAQRIFGPALPRLLNIWADGADAGTFVEWVAEQFGWTVEIVKRTGDQTGFVVQANRWMVERTLAW